MAEIVKFKKAGEEATEQVEEVKRVEPTKKEIEYTVVEVPQTMMNAIQYPDGKVYTFDAVIFDVLKRVAKLESVVG